MFSWFRKLFEEPGKLPDLGFQPRLYDLADAPKGTCVIAIENDDDTPMEFVVQVPRDYFGIPYKPATKLMLDVHTNGSADIRAMSRRDADRLVAKVRDEAARHAYPLQCSIRPVG